MIQKMSGPDPGSATALSKQSDVPQATLSKWLRKAGIVSSYVYPNSPDGIMPKIPKTPNDWSAGEKLRAVLENEAMPESFSVGTRKETFSWADRERK